MLFKKNIANISKYLFIILLFFLPLSMEKEFFNTGTKLLWFTEPICALLNIILIFYLIKNRKSAFRLSKIDILTFVFLASVLVSTLLSDDYFVSIKYTISLFWYFSGGYLVVRMFDFTRFQRKLSLIAFFSGTILLSLFILTNFIQMGIFYETSYKVSAPFIKEGHTDMSVVIEPALIFAAVLLLLIPFKGFKSNQNKTDLDASETVINIPIDKYKSIFGIATIATLFLAVIMFSCSKASYAALFLAFGAFALILLKQNPKYIIKLAYFLIPFVVIAGVWQFNDYRHQKEMQQVENSYYTSGSDHYDPNDRTTYKTTNMFDELLNKSRDTDKNDSNKERINRWAAGIHLFISNPTFGIGMGTYPDKYLDYQTFADGTINENYLTQNRMNLHNIFLGWLVEGGIFTFLAGCSLIVVFFIWFFGELKNGKKMFLKTFLFVYMISFIFHGLFHDFGQNARIIIPFWICLAVVSRQMVQKKEREEQLLKPSIDGDLGSE